VLESSFQKKKREQHAATNKKKNKKLQSLETAMQDLEIDDQGHRSLDNTTFFECFVNCESDQEKKNLWTGGGYACGAWVQSL
jgi:hypothetical protein